MIKINDNLNDSEHRLEQADAKLNIIRAIEKTAAGTLQAARDPSLYDLIVRTYPFGQRLSYVSKAQDVEHEDLQDSRGITLLPDDTTDTVVSRVHNALPLTEIDVTRVNEIERFFGSSLASFDAFIDVGFRIPRLVNHFSGHKLRSLGIDISSLNVTAARFLGFEAYAVDISSAHATMPVPEGKHLITCYHVIEHTPDPVVAVNNLVRMMGQGSVLIVEVPIEPGTPMLRFGHMSEFRHGDLKHMLESCGLSVTLLESGVNERVRATR